MTFLDDGSDSQGRPVYDTDRVRHSYLATKTSASWLFNTPTRQTNNKSKIAECETGCGLVVSHQSAKLREGSERLHTHYRVMKS